MNKYTYKFFSCGILTACIWLYCRYALVLIAMYNVWDLIGRYIPLIKCMKLESRKVLTIAILSRFLLVPAFYFTAKYGDQGWMIMLTSFLGLTNGYLTVCVLTSAPKGYKVRWFTTYLFLEFITWLLAVWDRSLLHIRLPCFGFLSVSLTFFFDCQRNLKKNSYHC